MTRLDNAQMAGWLRQAAELLQAQGANPFRVGAYRRAADTLDALPYRLSDRFADEGETALQGLPGIGSGIAAAVREMLRAGRWTRLDRLRGELDPMALFGTVPGIGPELAERIHEALGVDTLEALEVAAHDGRLEDVKGVGPRRAASIRAMLGDLLGRSGAVRRKPAAPPSEPAVAMLLDVDAEYRDKASAGALPTIAPRRFNPTSEAWLPILHTRRGDWHFTVLFSNTAQAHELGRTHDWVVLYFDADDHVEGQRTAVTEHRGPLAGRRVIRGRERECVAHYGADEPPAQH